MDKIFISTVIDGSLPELSYLCVIIGGIVAALIRKSLSGISRVTYFNFLAIILILSSLTEHFLILIPQAAANGYLGTLGTAVFSIYVVLGMLTYLASASRSVDIKGDRSNAWMGFVPIVNLYLLLKGGQRTRRSPLGLGRPINYLKKAAFIITGLVLLLIASTLNQMTEKLSDPDFFNTPALRQIIDNIEEPADRMTREKEGLEKLLPITWDDGTIVVATRNHGATLEVDLQISFDPSTLPLTFVPPLATIYCKGDFMRPVIMRGASIVLNYIYHDEFGVTHLKPFTIDSALCENLPS